MVLLRALEGYYIACLFPCGALLLCAQPICNLQTDNTSSLGSSYGTREGVQSERQPTQANPEHHTPTLVLYRRLFAPRMPYMTCHLWESSAQQ